MLLEGKQWRRRRDFDVRLFQTHHAVAATELSPVVERRANGTSGELCFRRQSYCSFSFIHDRQCFYQQFQ